MRLLRERMRYRLKKLPLDAAENLRPFPVDALEPYRPVPAPVYVRLAKNEKFVSIKGPMDFFTPREIDRLRSADALYFSDFIDRIEPFRQAARRIKAILSWQAPSRDGLEPAPYELSDSVLRTLANLWSTHSIKGEQHLRMETFHAVVFANEFCDPLPEDRVLQAREADVDRYELGILRSGLAVFLALHLGYLDRALLNQLRSKIFLEAVKLQSLSRRIPFSKEFNELMIWVEGLVDTPNVVTLSTDQFAYSLNRVSQKLKSRLFRVRRDLCTHPLPWNSVYGENGILYSTETEIHMKSSEESDE